MDRYSTVANRKNRQHIFARAVMTVAGVPASLYNSICIICLLTVEENQSIGSRRPQSYLGDVAENGTNFKRKTSRHLIPIHDERGVWRANLKKGFMQFIRERTNLICRPLEAEAGIRLFRREA